MIKKAITILAILAICLVAFTSASETDADGQLFVRSTFVVGDNYVDAPIAYGVDYEGFPIEGMTFDVKKIGGYDMVTLSGTPVKESHSAVKIWTDDGTFMFVDLKSVILDGGYGSSVDNEDDAFTVTLFQNQEYDRLKIAPANSVVTEDVFGMDLEVEDGYVYATGIPTVVGLNHITLSGSTENVDIQVLPEYGDESTIHSYLNYSALLLYDYYYDQTFKVHAGGSVNVAYSDFPREGRYYQVESIAPSGSGLVITDGSLSGYINQGSYTVTVYYSKDKATRTVTIMGVEEAANTVSITFKPNGGEGGDYVISDLDPNRRFGLPHFNSCDMVAPAGKEFAGWGLTPNATTFVTVLDPIGEDTTLYAIYKDATSDPETVTMTYYPNGGSGQAYVETGIRPGTAHTLLSYSLLNMSPPAGKVFAGWGAREYTSDYLTVYNIITDAKVYAQYKDVEAETYSVTYNPANTIDQSKTRYNIPAGTYVLESFEELGFTEPAGKVFIGWGTTAASTVTVNSVSVPSTKTVYALYKTVEEASYKITYKANGGTGSDYVVSGLTKGRHTLATFADTGFSAPTGKNFAGWGETPTSESYLTQYSLTGDVILYACYKANTYSLNYRVNGGNGYDALVTGLFAGEYTLKSYSDFAMSAPDGMAFAGWGLTADASSPVTTVTIPSTTVVFALYTNEVYKVTYVANGGTGANYVDNNIPAGEYVLKSFSTMGMTPPSGKVFLGWATTADSTSVVSSVNISGPTTIYAIYTDNVFKITYHANGGSGSDFVHSNIPAGTYTLMAFADTNIKAPEGQTFAGWSLTQANRNFVTEISVSKDMDFYAFYDSSFEVTFFNWNGYSYTSLGSVKTSGDVEFPAIDQIQGYAFSGWRSMEAGIEMPKRISTETPMYTSNTAKVTASTSFYTVYESLTNISEVIISGTSHILEVGMTLSLNAEVRGEGDVSQEVIWTSSDEAVATVNDFGVVKAVAQGTVTITATSVADNTKSSTYGVTTTEKHVPVTGIILNQHAAEIERGDTLQLTAIIEPEDATNTLIRWTVDRPEFATVSDTGLVNGLAEGTVTITATTVDGDKYDTCIISIVSGQTSTSVSLDRTSATLDVGESVTLHATVLPESVKDKTVTWFSKDTNVAIVDSEGVVTAVAFGSTEIIVQNGSNSAKCTIEVNRPAQTVEVTGVTLNESSITINAGDKIKLIATISPSNATNLGLVWTSSDVSVVKVDSVGQLTGLKAGRADITVFTNDGYKSATCTVNVIDNTVVATGIHLDRSHVDLEKGDSVTLVATVTPENATDKNVSWSSNNAAVATVDSNGKITAVAAGTAKITATAGNGSLSASCTVTVTSGGSSDDGDDIKLIIKMVNLSSDKTFSHVITVSKGATVTAEGQVLKFDDGTPSYSARSTFPTTDDAFVKWNITSMKLDKDTTIIATYGEEQQDGMSSSTLATTILVVIVALGVGAFVYVRLLR